MSQDQDEWLPEKKAAHLIGKSREWLQQRRKSQSGPVPTWYRIGNTIRYRMEDIKSYIEECRGR